MHKVYIDDHRILQEDLNMLAAWASKWQMDFNVTKCCIMQMSHACCKSHFTYSMRGLPT